MNLTKRPSCWYKAPKNEAHKLLVDYVEGVEKDQSAIFEGHVANAKMYSGLDLVGFRREGSTDYQRRTLSSITENVIRSVVDTAKSIVAKNQVRPVFATEDGDWAMQRRALLLEQYMGGALRDMNYHPESVDVFGDAAVYGTSALKFYEEGDRICGERALIDEIVVDEAECPTGRMPRKLHQRMFVEHDVLMEDYPEHADLISEAHGRGEWGGYREASGRLPVVEGWYLPSKGGTEGRHIIALENCTLVDEPWKFSFFPFAFLRWDKLSVGFYGQGLVEQLSGLQYELNRVTLFINTCQRLISNPKIFVDVASKILQTSIQSAKIGQIIPYRGKPPIFHTPEAVGAEIYTYQQALRTRMYEMAGISGYSARGTVPSGFESAVAQRELQTRDAGRFVHQEVQFENLCIDSTNIIIEMSKDLYTRQGVRDVKVPVKGALRRLKWKDVDIDRDRFQMSVEAASMMTKTPAARKQDAIELGQAGVITQEAAARLLKHPDIPYEMSMETASIEAVEACIERIYAGEMIPPDPLMDLKLSSVRMHQAYLKAKFGDADESILEDMRTWLQMAQDILQKAAPAAQPQMPMDPAAAMAAPDPMAMDPAMAAVNPAAPPVSAYAPTAMNIRPTTIPAR